MPNESACPDPQATTSEDAVTLAVENIGGIDRCQLEIEPGVTIFTGRNATNRTSFLSAVADVLGGSSATLKSDANRGQIEMTVGGSTYVRQYERGDEGFASSGQQYTEEEDLVDLFVRLLEDNKIRRAVERGEDLRDHLMRPVDTDRIQRELRDLRREDDRLGDRVAEIERERDRLPSLQSRQTEIENELESVIEEIDEVEAAIAENQTTDQEADQTRTLLDELEDLRNAHQNLDDRIERQNERLTDLYEEREDARKAIKDIDADDAELTSVKDELTGLRRRERDHESSIDDLRRIVRFNEDLISEEKLAPPGVRTDSDIKKDLDPMARELKCPTCGSTAERRAIADRIDELREVIDERRAERAQIQREISELEATADELQEAVDRRRDLKSCLDEINEEIETREERRDELEGRRSEVYEEITRLEEQAEEADDSQQSDLIEYYRRRSELEYRRGRLENERDDLINEIEEIENLVQERDKIETRRDEIDEKIENLQSRVERLERDAVEQFNEHMDALLELLEYRNVERVWLERKPHGTGGQSAFDLHVVRETDDGSVYEDSVETLSVSEREVIGLVVALAGYLVHDTYEKIPFILLDALEPIDANRIAALTEYFADYATYLLVALLPQDAQGLHDGYRRVKASALS